jgi:hypothetical protein
MTFMAYVYFEDLIPTSRIAESSTVMCNTNSNVEATQEQFVIQKEVKCCDMLDLAIARCLHQDPAVENDGFGSRHPLLRPSQPQRCHYD